MKIANLSHACGRSGTTGLSVISGSSTGCRENLRIWSDSVSRPEPGPDLVSGLVPRGLVTVLAIEPGDDRLNRLERAFARAGVSRDGRCGALAEALGFLGVRL